jgi:hypothetical protein
MFEMKLLRCLNKHHSRKTGMEVSLPVFLTFVPNGGEVIFALGKETPTVHWVERWMGPRVCLDTLKKGYQEKTVLHNNCSRLLLYFIPRPLHVSAFTGHHQVEHTI